VVRFARAANRIVAAAVRGYASSTSLLVDPSPGWPSLSALPESGERTPSAVGWMRGQLASVTLG